MYNTYEDVQDVERRWHTRVGPYTPLTRWSACNVLAFTAMGFRVIWGTSLDVLGLYWCNENNRCSISIVVVQYPTEGLAAQMDQRDVGGTKTLCRSWAELQTQAALVINKYRDMEAT